MSFYVFMNNTYKKTTKKEYTKTHI